MVLLELRRDSRVMTGNLGFLLLALKSNLPFGLRGGAGYCARVTAGQKRPHLGLCPGPNVPLQGPQGSQVCLPDSPRESCLVSREAKDSALLSSRDGYLLEPNVCTKGSQASCGVWREDSGLDSRPCRKRRPSSRDDGGVSLVFSSCGASVGCLM